MAEEIKAQPRLRSKQMYVTGNILARQKHAAGTPGEFECAKGQTIPGYCTQKLTPAGRIREGNQHRRRRLVGLKYRHSIGSTHNLPPHAEPRREFNI